MFKSLTLLFAFFTMTQATVADCGAGKSLFQIVDQGFSPEPPVSGQPYDYWFYYTVPDGVSVDAGTAKYSLNLNGIPFTPSTEDLCTQTFCPKTTGSYNESSHDTWPGGVSGKVVTKLEWFDADGNLLLCSQTTERV
jgi:hypothetical protein